MEGWLVLPLNMIEVRAVTCVAGYRLNCRHFYSHTCNSEHELGSHSLECAGLEQDLQDWYVEMGPSVV